MEKSFLKWRRIFLISGLSFVDLRNSFITGALDEQVSVVNLYELCSRDYAGQRCLLPVAQYWWGNTLNVSNKFMCTDPFDIWVENNTIYLSLAGPSILTSDRGITMLPKRGYAFTERTVQFFDNNIPKPEGIKIFKAPCGFQELRKGILFLEAGESYPKILCFDGTISENLTVTKDFWRLWRGLKHSDRLIPREN